jgi:hypothetical protein
MISFLTKRDEPHPSDENDEHCIRLMTKAGTRRTSLESAPSVPISHFLVLLEAVDLVCC